MRILLHSTLRLCSSSPVWWFGCGPSAGIESNTDWASSVLPSIISLLMSVLYVTVVGATPAFGISISIICRSSSLLSLNCSITFHWCTSAP